MFDIPSKYEIAVKNLVLFKYKFKCILCKCSVNNSNSLYGYNVYPFKVITNNLNLNENDFVLLCDHHAKVVQSTSKIFIT